MYLVKYKLSSDSPAPVPVTVKHFRLPEQVKKDPGLCVHAPVVGVDDTVMADPTQTLFGPVIAVGTCKIVKGKAGVCAVPLPLIHVILSRK